MQKSPITISQLIIALVFLLTGFISAYFVFSSPATDIQTNSTSTDNNDVTRLEDKKPIMNPFSVKDAKSEENAHLNYLENEIVLIKQQLQKIELTLENLTTSSTNPIAPRPANNNNRYASALTQRLYNLDSLIRGGIDSAIAEDIVRRKNRIELNRLELQDRAKRENYLNTQRYFDELQEINKQDISLREELGDDRYDEYLYASKQNNRIRITSVMLGSAAEQTGIEKGDIVLSYDNNRMFTWQELKDATTEGQLGEFVSINIYRKETIYSFLVPRGPLGVQLGATRLEP